MRTFRDLSHITIAALAALLTLITGCAARIQTIDGQRLRTDLVDNADVDYRRTYRIDSTCTSPRTGEKGTCIGTGVVIHESGILLTNRHVVEDDGAVAERISISIRERDDRVVVYPAKVLARSAHHDLAAIKIERTFSGTILLADKEEAEEFGVGDIVFTVGFPLNRGKDVAVGNIGQLGFSEPSAHPAAFGKSTAHGDVFYSVPTADGGDPYELKDDMRLHIDCAPGSSGSGVYLYDTGDLVGLVKVLTMPAVGRLPYYFEITAEPVSHIRAFLDEEKIPYHD